MTDREFTVFENGVIACGIKNPENDSLCTKIGKVRLFWKH